MSFPVLVPYSWSSDIDLLFIDFVYLPSFYLDFQNLVQAYYNLAKKLNYGLILMTRSSFFMIIFHNKNLLPLHQYERVLSPSLKRQGDLLNMILPAKIIQARLQRIQTQVARVQYHDTNLCQKCMSPAHTSDNCTCVWPTWLIIPTISSSNSSNYRDEPSLSTFTDSISNANRP